MDKELSFILNKVNHFKKRMINANLNLNTVKNNFPTTRSVFNKEQDIVDGDSINNLIIDYVSFFNTNKLLLETKATKQQNKINEIAYILAEMYAIYNELVNYADLMLLGKYQESIENQYSFLHNTANINLLNRLPEQNANEIINNNKINCLLSILMYKKNVDANNAKYNKYFEELYFSLYETYKKGKLSTEQYQYLLYIESFYYFLIGKQQLSLLSLGLLFHEFYENEASNVKSLLQLKSRVALKFIGLGKKPYLTMVIQDDFKKFVHYSLSNITQSKNDILIEKKRLLNQ